jgi:hypothetical protein
MDNQDLSAAHVVKKGSARYTLSAEPVLIYISVYMHPSMNRVNVV